MQTTAANFQVSRLALVNVINDIFTPRSKAEWSNLTIIMSVRVYSVVLLQADCES